MKTYSYGRTPNNVIREALPHKYSMELTKTTMIVLLDILKMTEIHQELLALQAESNNLMNTISQNMKEMGL